MRNQQTPAGPTSLRILFLSPWFPDPPDNGSKLRTFNLLRQLGERHALTLISFGRGPEVGSESPTLARFCRAVHVVPWRQYEPRSWRARLGFLSRVPRSLFDSYSPAMAARIRACLAADPYDVVITSELSTAAYAESFAGYAALFDDIELGILHEHPSRVTTARQRLRHRLTWYKHRRYLAALLPRFAACTVVSEQERHLLRSAVVAPPPITLIPNAVRVSDYADVSAVRHPTRLIYTGALTYAANDDAVRWFLSDIYPKIRAVVPEVELMVTGELGNQTLPAQPSVCFTGRVDDVRPLLASAAVSIVPLRIGAGTRLKILEAMVLGTPVVATTKGAEGLTLVDGEDLLIGDDPASFAQQVIRVLRDASLGQRLAQHAAVKVRNDYDWATLGPRFEALVREIALVGA